jgi:ribosomal protein S27AE
VKDIARVFTYTVALSLLIWAQMAHGAQKLKDADCLACHSDSTLTTDVNGKTLSLYVDEGKLKHSIHGRLFACVDCHTDVKSLAHDTPPKKITCGQCHADAQAAYARSAHAIARREGAAAAGCQDCHGGAHEVMAGGDPKSPVNHENIPYTCGRCHGQKFLMESRGQSAQPFISYQESVHGRATEKGSQKAAVCTDCHGAHEILPANDSKSPIYKFNVPATCGKCHSDVENTFMQSIHGQAIERGNAQAPVCTDCHGIQSRGTPIRIRRMRSGIYQKMFARAATRACGCRRSSGFRGTGFRVTLTAITGWPQRAVRWLRPTARAATGCTIFCRRAILARRSTRPIWTRPAGSATRA